MLVFFVLLDVSASIVHAFRLSFIRIPIVLVAVIAGVSAQLFVALMFLFYGSKVLKFLRRDADLRGTHAQTQRHSNRLRKMTKRIIGSGIGMLVFIASAVGAGTNVFNTPYGFFVCISGLYLGMHGISRCVCRTYYTFLEQLTQDLCMCECVYLYVVLERCAHILSASISRISGFVVCRYANYQYHADICIRESVAFEIGCCPC